MSDQESNNQQKKYGSENKYFNNRRGYNRNKNRGTNSLHHSAFNDSGVTSASNEISSSNNYYTESDVNGSQQSRPQYSSSYAQNYSDNYTERTVGNSELNPNAHSFISSFSDLTTDAKPTNDQRGAIVSGRYVRKHSNYGPRKYEQPSSNDTVDYDHNGISSSHQSNKNKPYTQRHVKNFKSFDMRSRTYPDRNESSNHSHSSESNERGEHSKSRSQSSFQKNYSKGFGRNSNFESDETPTSFRNTLNYPEEASSSRSYSNRKNRLPDDKYYDVQQSERKNRLPNDKYYDVQQSDRKNRQPSEQYYDQQNDRKNRLSSNYNDATPSDRKKFSDNGFASSDIYHYSSQNINDKRGYKYNKELKLDSSSSVTSTRVNTANQRELLTQRLAKGDCECLVCCEQIRVRDQTWHCLSCFHVFHLRCIRKWARSPAAAVEGDWRCPACQSLNSKVPYDYLCFCGKQKNPLVNFHLTPHTCGEICSRKRPECDHLCKELCHPGPCPQCAVVVQRYCACGKTFKTTTCKLSSEETCNSTCGKALNCGVHTCESKCHLGECETCEETISQECYCKKSKRSVTCSSSTASIFDYSCGTVCAQSLSCGNHTCDNICHPGPCTRCSLSVDVVKSCNCGKSSIQELVARGKMLERKSCTDPIPVCGEPCGKMLPCGSKDNPHRCQSLCHPGECPKCPLSTHLKCRCGAFTKEFSCAEISSSFIYLCEKRCNRRKGCGRHKCLNNCCINLDHPCELICSKKLSCGNHQCQERCHGSNCPPCWNVSFDELRCHCGESVLYPPIHCGTKPPECTQPCVRQHVCDHEVKHSCHSDETCPPCTVLTMKWCFGRHKQCGSVMCFLDGISCGMLCKKDMPCGKHKCNLTCHSGPCLKEDAKCTQLCATLRSTCGHHCGNPCHDGDCPENPCKAQVTLMCPCGHRTETTTCHDSTKSYRLMSVSVLASKMQDIKDGQSVNLNDVLGKKSKNNKLQCNEECAVIERNKRLAVALQIHNPDLSPSPGPPNYSEFLKTEAKKNPAFVSDVYEKISELVQLAKESKQKCRSHSFPPMNRDHRRVIHELAEFFGCETQSYDEEPKKSVVVTAYKAKCWYPFASIMTVVNRDMGIRKGPTPILVKTPPINSAASSSTNQKKKIDYFDYNE